MEIYIDEKKVFDVIKEDWKEASPIYDETVDIGTGDEGVLEVLRFYFIIPDLKIISDHAPDWMTKKYGKRSIELVAPLHIRCAIGGNFVSTCLVFGKIKFDFESLKLVNAYNSDPGQIYKAYIANRLNYTLEFSTSKRVFNEEDAVKELNYQLNYIVNDRHLRVLLPILELIEEQ
ncbi:MAG: hypothetical protein IJS93_00590 [Clostridia bacterium]|nr:hypothetical protein [Clostridia bacterium]